MIGRLALPLGVAGMLLAVALRTLGGPDPEAVGTLWSSRPPTAQDALAAGRLIGWVAVAGGLGWGLVQLLREGAAALRRAFAAPRRGGGAGYLLAAGLLLLAAGALHHAGARPTLAGGSVAQAEAALGR